MCVSLHSLYYFIQFSGQEIGASPVRGFIGLNTLRRRAVLLYNNIEERAQQQRILPSMNFSCSGNISKWTFVARSRTGGQHNQYPWFQLWRPDGTRRYRRVYESNITSAMPGQNCFTVEEYIPNDPVPFEAGYIIGIYQPENGQRRLSVVHVDVPGGYGYDNYHKDNRMSQEEYSISALNTANNYPLVAVETSEYKRPSDKQRCQPLSKNFCKIQGCQYGHAEYTYQCASKEGLGACTLELFFFFFSFFH